MLYFKNIMSCSIKIFLFLIIFYFYPVIVKAGNIQIYGLGGASYNQPIKSYKEALFDTVIRQRFDFSCGSAALATLLYHHYFYNISEEEVLKAMYAVGDRQKILQKGFSLLDMKNYLASEGLDSDGYKMPLEKLERAGVPSIALINNAGYLHFVVIKGIYGDNVLLGDPSLGLQKMSRAKFEKIWNGIAFVIKSDMSTAKTSFNLARDWNNRGKMYFDSVLSPEVLATYNTGASFVSNYYSY